MSETPDTDQLEDSDFHKYEADDAVPLSCYHRMTAHARDMEASAKSAANLLGKAWDELTHLRRGRDEAREIAKEACAMLADNGFETNYPPMPWDSDSLHNDQGLAAARSGPKTN